MQLILTFVILGLTIFLFMSNRVRADLVSLIALLAFVMTGILDPAEALAGFSNSVVIMIAALFVVGAGILRTGLARKASNLLLRWTGNSEKKLFFLLLVIVAGVGAFMSNTGTVAIMLPVATALEKTGGMVVLSEGIIDVAGGYGPLGVLAGIYLITMVFGQFISNTATAVLFAPIAMNIGVSPYPFLITVAAAASMAFATPVASPTNAMVMTAGGYKFSDFLKIGIPLQIVMFIVMMFIIPLFFPF
ncbi:SLC13 family permease [Cytobacillus sp.]|uniref:SLC13 family permease n=1 Tax=Cytobacillus sp. TaxID=2675269 RepID=UPI0028BD3A9E|nr:SLC13 family permease [Cytobacillus sp.]